jgi:DNA-binding transcriptional LysR family regulator
VLHGPGGPRTLAVKAVLAASDFTFLHEAALAHAGIAVQPDLVVQGDLAAGRLVRVLPEWNAGTAGLYAVHPAGRVLPARVRAFRDLLVEHFSHA